MMSESEVQQLIQIEARKHGIVLMRNNSGSFKNNDGRWVRFGLNNLSAKQNAQIKSSDLIGIKPVTITNEMVGQTFALFIAIEVKAEEWSPAKKLDAHEIAQKNFMDWVRHLGGLSGFCNGVDSLITLLRN